MKGALIITQYKGALEDGMLLDSSYKRGRLFQCVIGTGWVIKGWDQGLIGMKVGDKRRLFIPSHLAYDERRVGAHIEPHSNLLLEIELLEVLARGDWVEGQRRPLAAMRRMNSHSTIRPTRGRLLF